MNEQTPVVESVEVENEPKGKEQLRIRKITVGTFQNAVATDLLTLTEALDCGTCSRTGCSTYLICSEGCRTV